MSEATKMGKPTRRIVTGHDAEGKAVILRDGASPKTLYDPGHKLDFYEIWNTNGSPAPLIAGEEEPTDRPIRIPPQSNGTIIRICDFHPGGLHAGAQLDAALAAKSFATMGDARNSTYKPGAPHPMMHRTQSIDYGIVLEGEIYLILDDAESLIKAGDIVVQRGTNHAWDNRSDAICRMVFILIDGIFTPELSRLLERYDG